jgi:hypothetical protein
VSSFNAPISPGVATEHVPREPVEHNHIRERAGGGLSQVLVLAIQDLRVEGTEAPSNLFVEVHDAPPPAMAMENQNARTSFVVRHDQPPQGLACMSGAACADRADS